MTGGSRAAPIEALSREKERRVGGREERVGWGREGGSERKRRRREEKRGSERGGTCRC